MNADIAISHVTVPVTGMSCAACAVSVESMLKHTPGVADAGVNYANQSVRIDFDPEATDLPALDTVLQGIGYGLIIEEDEEAAIAEQEKIKQAHYNKLRRRTIWAGILALPVVVIGMFMMDLPYGNFIMMALTLPVLAFFGQEFFINAWKQARHGKANMDTLVALSTGIAFLFSTFNAFFPAFWHSRGLHPHVYFESAAIIIFFILLGKLIEERAKSSTSDALKKLIGLQPKTVRIIRDGVELELGTKEVLKGDEIIIRAGEKIPVDGTVSSGNSYVDESLMTGESIPAEKVSGTKVFAGTINQNGSFTFIAEKVGKQTLLAQIIRTVQDAQGSKAPVQRLVDQIAGIFVPVVILIAIVTFLAWMFFGGENALTHALLTSVSVLVIACPCALGLATPTAIMVGVGKGAENNMLIRDAASLEKAHEVDTIVLDKTGTLTEGRPSVTDWIWKNDLVKTEKYLPIIRSLESRSEHPLARAIVDHLPNAAGVSLNQFQSVTGKGVEGVYDNVTYRVGTLRWLIEAGVSIDKDLESSANVLLSQARTVVYATESSHVIAVIAIHDALKSTTREAITTLKSRGMELHMLTGDNEQTANAIATELGILHVKAEVKPGDKMDYVRTLQEQGKVVAMVGDGINDSQAMAQADLSVAMGKGSDIAMDVARMVLITSDLRVLPQALRLSKKTVATIRQNLFWAFIYNLIGIPLAAGVLYPINGFLLNPMIAGAAMGLSSVSVVMNSLRLRGGRL